MNNHDISGISMISNHQPMKVWILLTISNAVTCEAIDEICIYIYDAVGYSLSRMENCEFIMVLDIVHSNIQGLKSEARSVRLRIENVPPVIMYWPRVQHIEATTKTSNVLFYTLDVRISKDQHADSVSCFMTKYFSDVYRHSKPVHVPYRVKHGQRMSQSIPRWHYSWIITIHHT